MTTYKNKSTFMVSHLHLTALAASGVLLMLSAGVASAQTAEDLQVSAPPGSNKILTLNPAAEAPAVDDEPSDSLEFISPIRSITTAPPVVNTDSTSPVVNPSGNMLSGGTIHMPPASAALTFDAPRTASGSRASKLLTCTLLGGGLLALGVVGARAVQVRPGRPTQT